MPALTDHQQIEVAIASMPSAFAPTDPALATKAEVDIANRAGTCRPPSFIREHAQARKGMRMLAN